MTGIQAARAALNFGTGALLALALAAPLAAQEARPKAGAERVIDTFNVGSNVYVRGLTPEASRNVMWVGTSSGVHEIDLKTLAPRNTFTRDHGLANEYVFAVGIDAGGYKWFGTNAGGTSRYRDGKWKTFFPMHGLADYWIYAFANQKDGTLWIGTWAGANAFNPKTGKFRTYVKELINEWVYGIAVDARDRVWFGTEGGVSMFDGKAWKSWTHKDGLGAPNLENLKASGNTGLGTRSRHDLAVGAEGLATYNPNYVFAVHVAPDGAVWAGTWGGGVARFDGKQWKNYTTKDGLAGNIVYSIAQDAEGVFWFGTSHGVSRFDGKTWRSFGRKEGLLDSNVYALAVAPNGNVWAGTRGGVARIGKL
ncbi:MAG: regulator [Betaproteobacteria bacterium]|nr:regulator [Betaproteobacteria bacterium]